MGVLGARRIAGRRTLSSLIVTRVGMVLAIVLVAGFALSTWSTHQMLFADSERQALAIAHAVAADDDVRDAIASGDRAGVVARLAEQVRDRTGAAYVVVVDAAGVRHSHPNPALIGLPLEEPLDVLDGQDHVGADPGSLGESANGKAPLFGVDRRIIGEVSVGILSRDVAGQLLDKLPSLGLWVLITLVVGAVASWLLARRLKRMTFGLELDDLARLLSEREAMLHGIREGVLAVDERGELAVVNDEARRLLGLQNARLGQPLDALVGPSRLRDLLSGEVEGPDELVLVGDRLLVVNRRPVTVSTRSIGAVVTVRDHTELDRLGRELEGATGLTDALRAQQHEFANRLHVASVLVGMGDSDEALAYLDEVSRTTRDISEDLRSRVDPPALAALLIAKMTVAAERGVDLVVGPGAGPGASVPPGDPVAVPDAQVLVTIVGNLVDNAVDAAVEAPGPRRVHVTLDSDDGRFVVTVTDSGRGLSPDQLEQVFTDGYTTKQSRDGLRRGVGLALVHRIVNREGGRIDVASGPGGRFTVTLPHTTSPVPPPVPPPGSHAVPTGRP